MSSCNVRGKPRGKAARWHLPSLDKEPWAGGGTGLCPSPPRSHAMRFSAPRLPAFHNLLGPVPPPARRSCRGSQQGTGTHCERGRPQKRRRRDGARSIPGGGNPGRGGRVQPLPVPGGPARLLQPGVVDSRSWSFALSPRSFGSCRTKLTPAAEGRCPGSCLPLPPREAVRLRAARQSRARPPPRGPRTALSSSGDPP